MADVDVVAENGRTMISGLSVSNDSNSKAIEADADRGTDPAPADMPLIDTSTPLFRVRSFALLFISRLSSNGANQMMAVAVGWQVYELTGSALHLGLIGLVQFAPPLLLMLATGQVADRYNRRLILRLCYVLEFCASAGLLVVSVLPQTSITAIYLLLLLNAVARTFEQPAMGSLLPIMVPRALLSRADRRPRFRRQAVGLARALARRPALCLRSGRGLRHLQPAGAVRLGGELPAARSARDRGPAEGKLGHAAGGLPLHLRRRARTRLIA